MDYIYFAIVDDLFARFFLDTLYLWYETTRMSINTVIPDSEPGTTINILRSFLINGRPNLSGCANAFMKFPYFINFLENKDYIDKSKFAAHLKKYVSMFMPDAGFEISSTSRYTGRAEACITSTKVWKKGEYIKNCTGTVCRISEDIDKRLRTENMDFSVMMSERKRNAYLFLGPARFINHDCDPNCVFVQQASNVTFRALKVIKLGDELTVSYGDHYFGIDNCECRCLTCEKNERGFYLKKVEEKLEEASTLSRRLRKRKDIQYAEINPKRKNSTTCASVGSDAHDVSATSNVSDVCAPSSIKTIMSIANICNLSNVTPKLSAFGFKEAFEPTVQLYPEDTSVSIQETPAPLKCCLWASAYTKSTDDDKCVRCFRHFKIFNLVWPQRKH